MFIIGTLIMLILNMIGFINAIGAGVHSELLLQIGFQTLAWLLIFLSSFGGVGDFKTFK